jgi:hypothetical protein
MTSADASVQPPPSVNEEEVVVGAPAREPRQERAWKPGWGLDFEQPLSGHRGAADRAAAVDQRDRVGSIIRVECRQHRPQLVELREPPVGSPEERAQQVEHRDVVVGEVVLAAVQRDADDRAAGRADGRCQLVLDAHRPVQRLVEVESVKLTRADEVREAQRVP